MATKRKPVKKAPARKRAPVETFPLACLMDARGNLIALGCWTTFGPRAEAGDKLYPNKALAEKARTKGAPFVAEHWLTGAKVPLVRWAK